MTNYMLTYNLFRAYSHINYSLSSECKTSNTLIEGFKEDDETATTDETPKVDTDVHLERAATIAESKICKIAFQPRIDTLSIKRLFPPGHKLSLEFIRSPSHFSLIDDTAGANYKIEILDLKLRIRQILPVESVESSFRKNLETKTIHFPLTRLVTRTRTLCAGIYDGTIINAITGPLPHHIFITLLSNSQINGSLTSNPFFFGRRNLESASLLVNSTQYPSEKLLFKPTNGDVLRSYSFFNQNIGAVDDQSVGITSKQYLQNDFALAFDLSPDMSMNASYHKQLEGSIDIKLTFDTELTSALTVLYVMSYDDVISIAPDKSVMLTYQI